VDTKDAEFDHAVGGASWSYRAYWAWFTKGYINPRVLLAFFCPTYPDSLVHFSCIYQTYLEKLDPNVDYRDLLYPLNSASHVPCAGYNAALDFSDRKLVYLP
jgi:hypothetical protein